MMHSQPHESAQYAAAQLAPLIKNPGVRVPRQATLPPDIHPLPLNISDYIVYPFAVENHVLTIESGRRTTQASHAARRENYLKSRDQEKERRKRETLRRVAPGFDPSASQPLTPTKAPTSPTTFVPGHAHKRSVMDDLVDQLAALDAKESESSGKTDLL